MGVCGTPWVIADAATVLPGIAHRIPGTPQQRAEIIRDSQAFDAICLICADGVLVITLQPDTAGLEFVLFVLLCVGYSPGAFQRRDPDLDKLAADLGASSIAMRPARRGWERLMRAPWIKQGELFTREVDHGRQASGRQANTTAARTG